MAPKKQFSGFVIFAKEYRQDQEEMGKKMPQAIGELLQVASGPWKALNDADRKRYNDIARGMSGKRDKMDSTGRLVKDIEREKQEKIDEEIQMVNFIANYIESLGDIKAIAMERFYLISFNIFCKTVNDMYFPAEVGLVEFSLLEGVIKSYHAFIDPGELPMGMKSECKMKSEMTHKIPWLGFHLAESDYKKIFDSIVDFIDPNHDIPQYPPIYCLTYEIAQTKELLNMFKSHSDRTVDFAVLDFAQLFYELYIYAKTDMISVGVMRDFLKNSTYTYRKHVSCKWHWDLDSVEYCSLGIVRRSCFIMFDYLCELYNVRLMVGRHVPKPEEAPVTSLRSNRRESPTRTTSSASSRSDWHRRSNNSPSVAPHSGRSPSSVDSDSARSQFSSYHSTCTPNEWTQSQSPSASGRQSQFRSVSVKNESGGQTSAWNSSRMSNQQTLSQPHPNEYPISQDEFPSLGRGHGGARPKEYGRPQSYRVQSTSSRNESSPSLDTNRDPRISSRGYSDSDYLDSVSRNSDRGSERDYY